MKYILNKNLAGPVWINEYDQIMKLNYNCPAEQKTGTGPGSCKGINDLKSNVQQLHQKRATGHNVLRNKLTNIFSDSSKFQVTGRLKTPQSIQEKMQRKGITDPSEFDDISGLRIITKNNETTKEAIQKLKTNFKYVSKPGTEDNYIENPKETGYHAYHITVMQNGEPHEVQVRTERFNEWAETYHSVYKGEEWTKEANTPETRNYFNKMADVYQALDDGRNIQSIPECPKELAKINLCLKANV